MRNAQILGEYIRVSQLTKNPQLLQDAHMTPIETAQEAIKIIREILPECFVRFRSRRARALTYYGQKVISLPKEKLNVKNGGGLRLGVVLHEAAHHIAGLKEKHGPAFVAALDELVKRYADRIKPERKIEVKVKLIGEEKLGKFLSADKLEALRQLVSSSGDD